MRRYQDHQDVDSIILKSTVRFIFLAVCAYAGYITVKGHNEPGGGFIGGLVAALALVLVNMVLGLDEVKRIVRFDPVLMAATGLLLSYTAAFFPLLLGGTFFEHRLQIGGSEVPTALIFDSGVFLVVVGVVSKLIITFSSSVQGRSAFLQEEELYYSTVFEVPIEEAAFGELAPGLEDVLPEERRTNTDDPRLQASPVKKKKKTTKKETIRKPARIMRRR